MVKKSEKVFAFWKYDMFPYLLYGEIDEKETKKIDGKIHYYVPSYQGYVKPSFSLAGKEGEKMCESLQSLRAEYRQQKEILHISFMAKLNAVLIDVS
jgi:hypothetical protein